MKTWTLFVATVAVGLLAIWVARPLKKKAPPVIEPIVQTAYPRVAMYSWQRGNGDPFARGGRVDTAEVRRAARWDAFITDPARVGPTADAQRLHRSLAPAATLLAYVNAGKYFQCGAGWTGGPVPYGCDTSGQNFAWSRWVAIRAFDAALPNGVIDFARPGMGRALAETTAAWVTDAFNGAFVDEVGMGPPINGDSAWTVAYREGVWEYWTRLRELMGSRLIVGNGGQYGPRFLNGWMRENFPWQNGNPATWHTNMLGWGRDVPNDVGYLGDDTTYVAPRMCWLTAWGSSGDPADRYNQWRARWTLASATLAGGVGVLTWSPTDAGRGYSPRFWWDELSVDAAGVSDTTGAHKGWLGSPSGPARKVGPVWRHDFAHGAVLVNPSSIPVTIEVGAGYRRIRGRLATVVNNGEAAAAIVLPASDGVFLWREP